MNRKPIPQDFDLDAGSAVSYIPQGTRKSIGRIVEVLALTSRGGKVKIRRIGDHRGRTSWVLRSNLYFINAQELEKLKEID
jgi:hypothetical protein